MNRGSASDSVGDQIYLIETTYTHPNGNVLVYVKTFPSRPGFNAGLRAVRDEWKAHCYPGAPTVTYKTFTCFKPDWTEFTP